MTENSTALLFDILDTATQGDPDSAANNIALLNQLLTATDNDPSNISANEIALLTEILSIITDQPPDVAANEIAVLTEILSAIQTQNPQVRENKIALLNEITANSQSLVDALNPLVLPVAASDLVAWYPFRSGTGEDIIAGDGRFADPTDYSGIVQGVSFSQSPVTDIQTGANSQAAVGDGVDDRIDIPNDTCSFNTASGNITVCFWTRPDDDTREVAVEIADPIETFIQKAPPARPDRMTINTFDGNNAVFAGAPFTVGQLDHFAFMHTNNELRAFKNGQRVTTTPAPDSITRSEDLALFDGPGRRFSSPEYGGLFDDVRIYQGGLSDSEINQIYLNTEP